MAEPIPFERAEMVRRLASDRFDVLVIGGGITGCGIALDAATRGLRVALVERDDFASGTSSRSSKLVHGGLRYLQHGDVRLVYQALRERQRLLRNAPHLVTVLPFLIPVLTKDGPVSKKIAKTLRSALWMYDVTGGARIGKLHRRLDASSALAHCPTLPAARLSSGFVYYDASTDDARLTLTIAHTAARHGAVLANRCEVVELTRRDGGDATSPITGAIVDTGSERVAVNAAVVVSATGVWADSITRLAEPASASTLRPAKGVHITVPWHLVRNDIAVIVSVPKDKRSLFLIPWGARPDGTFDHCYIGTTDTDYDGDLDEPQTGDDDLDYVLRAVNHSLTTTITRDDVTGVWAGLRPLARSAGSDRTADLSRRHRIDGTADGLLTVTGGKLTTYREMAEDTVDLVMRRLGRSGRCRTRRLALAGAEGGPRSSQELVTHDPLERHLKSRYGAAAPEVRALIADDASLAEPLVPGLAYCRAEAVYAARHEMATTLDDVLLRRTRAHLQDRAACLAAADDVARLLAGELGWSDAERAAEVATYQRLCEAERQAAAVSQ